MKRVGSTLVSVSLALAALPTGVVATDTPCAVHPAGSLARDECEYLQRTRAKEQGAREGDNPGQPFPPADQKSGSPGQGRQVTDLSEQRARAILIQVLEAAHAMQFNASAVPEITVAVPPFARFRILSSDAVEPGTPVSPDARDGSCRDRAHRYTVSMLLQERTDGRQGIARLAFQVCRTESRWLVRGAIEVLATVGDPALVRPLTP